MKKKVSDSCVFSGVHFLLLVCFVQLQRDGCCFIILFYFVMFCCSILEAYSFLMGDRERADANGRVDKEDLG